MDWPQYAKKFRIQAKKRGFTKDYVSRCLDYAKPLNARNLPIIYDQEHLALLVGYSAEYLHRASNGIDHFYRRFTIPKKAGGKREIAEPLPSLKEIQRWILDNILYRCNPSKFAKGFVPGSSIRDNARFHRKQPQLLSLDIENFFGSIKTARVYHYFSNLGYCKPVVMLLTRLCTLNGALPQGAPTSPALSNLISLRLDRRLSAFAIKHKIRYTRYADDLAFSGEFAASSVIRLVRTVLKDEGLKLNEDKTRLMLKHNRQEVTGVVVNEKLQAPRVTRRELRKAIYYIEKYGVDSHMEFTHITQANYVNHIKGIANFILFINPKDGDATHAFAVLSDS